LDDADGDAEPGKAVICYARALADRPGQETHTIGDLIKITL